MGSTYVYREGPNWQPGPPSWLKHMPVVPCHHDRHRATDWVPEGHPSDGARNPICGVCHPPAEPEKAIRRGARGFKARCGRR